MEWELATARAMVKSSGHSGNTALKEGEVILDGRYRIERLLYQRPRVNLYLGRRITQAKADIVALTEESEPLVAIRELLLADLGLQVRAQIEAAVLEEFISPVVLGSSQLPELGTRFSNSRSGPQNMGCSYLQDSARRAVSRPPPLRGPRGDLRRNTDATKSDF